MAFIHLTAEVDPEATIGDNVAIWNWSKLCRGSKVGDQTKIGQCVYIDRDVVVGRRCKIQNGVSVYTGVEVADDVFIGPNVTFTNDLYPRARSMNWHITSTAVEEGASIGANATIICGVVLGAHCMIAAGALVTKDVPPYSLVMGQPARVVDYVNRSGRPLKWDLANGKPPQHILDGADD